MSFLPLGLAGDRHLQRVLPVNLLLQRLVAFAGLCLGHYLSLAQFLRQHLFGVAPLSWPVLDLAS
jgi:hypothetical protein